PCRTTPTWGRKGVKGRSDLAIPGNGRPGLAVLLSSRKVRQPTARATMASGLGWNPLWSSVSVHRADALLRAGEGGPTAPFTPGETPTESQASGSYPNGRRNPEPDV